GQSRDGLDLAVDGVEVAQFEQIAEPPHVGLYRHLPRAAALRQSYELVGHDQAPAEMLRGPERPVPAVERARQGHRVAEPARNVERLLAEREAALHGVREVVDRDGQPAQDLRPQRALTPVEQPERFLEKLDESRVELDVFGPPLAAQAEDGADEQGGSPGRPP